MGSSNVLEVTVLEEHPDEESLMLRRPRHSCLARREPSAWVTAWQLVLVCPVRPQCPHFLPVPCPVLTTRLLAPLPEPPIAFATAAAMMLAVETSEVMSEVAEKV